MTNFKRFSREELRKYVADHKIGVNSKYVSEPHTIVVKVNPKDIVSVPVPIKKKRRNRGYRGPATHFEVMGVVGDKLSIVLDREMVDCNFLTKKLSVSLKERGIKFHVYEDWKSDNHNRIWFRTRKEAGKALTYLNRVDWGDFAVIKCYDENC